MGTWNYVLNDKFAEEYGEGAQERFVQMLGEVAGHVRPGDRDGAMAMLDEGFERVGFEAPKLTRDQLAENLTLAEHDRVIVSDDSGAVLAEYALPGEAGASDEERHRHVEPEDDERPAYS